MSDSSNRVSVEEKNGVDIDMEANSPGVNLSMQKELEVDQQEQSNPLPSTDEIPNGGLVAWLQVGGAFFLLFNSWGMA